jgi:hypothetical protein
VEPYVPDLTGLGAAEHMAAGADLLVNDAGFQAVRPCEEFPPDVLPASLTAGPEAAGAGGGRPGSGVARMLRAGLGTRPGRPPAPFRCIERHDLGICHGHT